MTAIKILVLLTLLAVTVAAQTGDPWVDSSNRLVPPQNPGRDMEPWVGESDTLRVDEIITGEWLPLRTQPTYDFKTPSQHSTRILDYNLQTCQKMLDHYAKSKPALLIRGPFGRLLVGCQDGLVKGMRPRLLSGSFQGSCLMEQAPGWDPQGKLEVASLDAAVGKLELRWRGGDASRVITVDAKQGLVSTRWTKGPARLSVFTSVFPYAYLGDEGRPAVRFSQLVQARRELLGTTSHLSLFGYRGAALEITAQGGKAVTEEVWLDSGELSWQWVHNFIAANPNFKETWRPRRGYEAEFGQWFRENAAFTYPMGGGTRKLDFEAVGDWAVEYRLSTPAEGTLAEGGPGVRVKAVNTSLRTPRIWPNDFNGWKLRPLRQVQINPMPAYYELTLANQSNTPVKVEFTLPSCDWLDSAALESDPVMFTAIGQIPEYRSQSFGQKQPSLELPSRGTKTVLLKIQPREETFGDYDFNLGWKSASGGGTIPLRLSVRISSLVSPMRLHLFADQTDYPYWTFTTLPCYDTWAARPPSPEGDKYLDLLGQHLLRKGLLCVDKTELRSYVDYYTQKTLKGIKEPTNPNAEKYWSVPPAEFVAATRRDTVMRQARSPYRAWVYLYDEIFEILGGYKGRHYMPLPEFIKMSEDLIMGCPTPCYPSFMQQDLDVGNQVLLPNDIPLGFIYSGNDSFVELYMHKQLEPWLKQMDEWKRTLGWKGGPVRPMSAFWISAQLHVTDYQTMRRQYWYARHLGIDMIHIWDLRWDNMVYAEKIGGNSLLYAGNGQCVLTDRSLAWLDMCEDTELINTMLFLKERAEPTAALQAGTLWEQAFQATRNNDFDLARQLVSDAARLLAPGKILACLPPRLAKVMPAKLENLTEKDEDFDPSGKPRGGKRTVLGMLKGGLRPPPTLDGSLDNSYLEEGLCLDNFSLLNTLKRPNASTSVYLARDTQNLYALFLCVEPDMDKLQGSDPLGHDDAKLFRNDCIELFLDRVKDGEGYMQFAVDCAGNTYEQRKVLVEEYGKPEGRLQLDWNPSWEVKTFRSKDSWAAELRIPFSEIGGAPTKGEKWRINFARERQTKPELSMWSPQCGGFGVPAQFGEITFGD